MVQSEHWCDWSQKLSSFFHANFGWHPPVLILSTSSHKKCFKPCLVAARRALVPTWCYVLLSYFCSSSSWRIDQEFPYKVSGVQFGDATVVQIGEMTHVGSIVLEIIFAPLCMIITLYSMMCYVFLEEEKPPKLFFWHSRLSTRLVSRWCFGKCSSRQQGTWGTDSWRHISWYWWCKRRHCHRTFPWACSGWLQCPITSNIPTATTHQSTDPTTVLFHSQAFHWNRVYQTKLMTNERYQSHEIVGILAVSHHLACSRNSSITLGS